MTIFYIHWDEAELQQRIKALNAEEYKLIPHSCTEVAPKLPDNLPDVFVISIDRLPSHGKAVADWLWEAKKRQHIPIIFEGGKEEKIAAIRLKFPKAIFVPTGEVTNALRKMN